MIRAQDDEGLSEVVGFVLLLGVLVLALSVYQLYAVPAAGRENEIAHMNQVKDRFTDYKIALDSLWVNHLNGVTLSTAFDLGSGTAATEGGGIALPVLAPVGSSGAVEVRSDAGAVTIATGDNPGGVRIPLGLVQYVSGNNYWVDQTWTYQMGAVFLTQEGGTTVRVAPPLSVYNINNTTAAVRFTPVNITGSALFAGSGPVRIESRLRDMPPYDLDGLYENVTITVETGDAGKAQALKQVFREATRNGGVPAEWYSVGTDAGGTVSIRVDGPGPEGTPDVALSVTTADYAVTVFNAASLIE
ncbi:hypothetical protein E2N92_09920 [Methanofollis formosanus]|uniref:Uncharacterized protein n=1 Tax=Methanofollis formosanus TaxID=299308 RepID=A0A8G1A3H5_9EURY|nr:hypothetical protein [Methanofollis formosanus]QYZ79719.1 hypothetical protein E2N92_09920 [Methanofollis formosanus]